MCIIVGCVIQNNDLYSTCFQLFMLKDAEGHLPLNRGYI